MIPSEAKGSLFSIFLFLGSVVPSALSFKHCIYVNGEDDKHNQYGLNFP